MQTVSDRVRLKRMKLSAEGEQVLLTLQREYGMDKEVALRLIREGGPMFASLIPVGNGVPDETQDQTSSLKRRVAALQGQLEELQKLGVER